MAVAAWLTVVLVGSTLVWAVISRTGQELVGATTATESAATGPTRPGHRGGATDRPSATGSKRPDGTSSGRPSASTGTATHSSAPTGSGRPTPTTTATRPPSSSAPAVARGSWSGVGGVVIVQCRAEAISLVSATPDAGFSVEVEKEERSLEVKFQRQGDDDRETKVEARCVAGEPRFTVESDDGGEEDDGEPEG